MNAELAAIPKRIRELREILAVEADEMAKRLATDAKTYRQYETGEIDIPIGVLYAIAEILGVDPTVLLTGDTPRMDRYSVTRAGQGVLVERYPGYNYRSLSFNFQHRNIDPLLVTVVEGKEPSLVTHPGQEFNYVLKGKIKVTVGARQFVLSPGDCIYFDPTLPHGQASVEGESVFLTIIKES